VSAKSLRTTKLLGSFELTGIPAGSARRPPDRGHFRPSTPTAIVHVTAKDKGTGKENTIKNPGRLRPVQGGDRPDDQGRRGARGRRPQASRRKLTSATRPRRWSTRRRSSSKEQREAEGGSKVPEDTLNKVDAAVAEAKTALGGTDIGAIKSAMEKLGQESQALGQAIYESTQAEASRRWRRARSRAELAPMTLSTREVVDDDREGQ